MEQKTKRQRSLGLIKAHLCVTACVSLSMIYSAIKIQE